MHKLCCVPLSETPEVGIKVNCISSCCASDVKSKDNDSHVNEADIIDVTTVQKPVRKEKRKKSCCGKKRLFFKSQAKGGEREDN